MVNLAYTANTGALAGACWFGMLALVYISAIKYIDIMTPKLFNFLNILDKSSCILHVAWF